MPPVVEGDIPPFNYSGIIFAGAMNSSFQDRVGPEACRRQYYFNDLWTYHATNNQWVQKPTTGDKPRARRGHSMIVRRSRTNDTQVVIFGGNHQDQALSDMWVLDLSRQKSERQWTRIDQFFKGLVPPSTSGQTMVYSPSSDRILVFGGLHWEPTDLLDTDRQRNVDRRCYKMAQGLPDMAGEMESAFLAKMRQRCAESDFCCVLTDQAVPPDSINGILIRTNTSALNLTAISMLCRAECDVRAFVPDFSAKFSEGVWIYHAQSCEGGCSGHGTCDLSICVCQPGFYGTDCSFSHCPGSSCYTHPRTKEQFCIECSQHGRCVDGVCQCYPGWGYDDCSAALCEGNCSSNETHTQGICVEDFPVHQCSCVDNWSGDICNESLCLNQCSGRGHCWNHTCSCEPGYHGEDCSLFLFPI